MSTELIEDRTAFLSKLKPTAKDYRLVGYIVLVSLIVFFICAPLAKLPLAQLPPFIAVYDSTLFVNYLITAVLLYGHASILRSRALLALANGFLFVSMMIVGHLLSFPQLFSNEGLFGPGYQGTAWIFEFWHLGFPVFVTAYATQMQQEQSKEKSDLPAPSVALNIVLVLVLSLAAATIAIKGQSLLPELMQNEYSFAPRMVTVVSTIWLVNLLTLIVLWRKKPHSVLDLWLMVTVFAWLFEIALVALLNAGRYDFGFYAGRIYGFLAASLVLVVLLSENGRLYARLMDANESERKKSRELEKLSLLDALTRIANRRAFEESLSLEWRRMTRNKAPLSLLMIDVDFFKNFNDTYGHVAGDQCLQTVAEAIAESTKRAGDVVARYGGEEFAVLLPNTSNSEAQQIAGRICSAVRELGIPHAQSTAAKCVTVSIGLASVHPAMLPQTAELHEQPIDGDEENQQSFITTPMQLVETADLTLYVAKISGRNQFVAAPASASAAAILAGTSSTEN